MTRLLALVAAVAAVVAGCSTGVEQPVLAEFFHAARLRDRTALQKLSAVPFDPAVQGIVTDFTITRVTDKKESQRRVRDVSITAPVRSLSGDVANHNMVVTIEAVAGRWLVTGIREASSSGL